MFKMAKSIDVNNEKISIDVVNNDTLNIKLEGIINNETYLFDLIIKKDLDEHNNIPLYDKIELNMDDTFGSDLIINDKIIYVVNIKVTIMNFSDKFVYEIHFNDSDYIYYGSCQLEIKKEELENLLK